MAVSDEMKEGKLKPEPDDQLVRFRCATPHDDEARTEYPNLMRLLYPKYDDKGRMTREAGYIRLSIEGQVYTLTLVCPTEGVQCSLSTPTCIEPLAQLEHYVTRPFCAWGPTWERRKKAGQGLKNLL